MKTSTQILGICIYLSPFIIGSILALIDNLKHKA